MADMRDAMKRAGIVSDKQVRRAKHQKRVHRKEVGQDGLEAERLKKEAEFQKEQELKREADKVRAIEQRQQQELTQQEASCLTLIREENLLLREAGTKRFYFQLPTDYISFVEISPGLARRLAQGDAAIVDAESVLPDGFAVLSGKAAHHLSQMEKERIIFWAV
jgi:Uncharacterized protein conserved in bacteria (DUF2058)